MLLASEALELADGASRAAGRGPGGGVAFLFPLLLLLLIGFLVFKGTRRPRHAAYAAGGRGAMGTLSERFARGEISREEFEYRRAVLNNDKEVPAAPSSSAPPASGTTTTGTAPADPPPDDSHS